MSADLIPLGEGAASTPVLTAAATTSSPLERLPGTSADDPFQRLAAAWLLSYGGHTQTAYRRDLTAWARWCTQHDVHPLAAQRFHVDAWVRHLTTQPQPRTGRPTTAATIARRLSALSGFYDYGIHDAQVLTHSPVASVRRPRVSDDSQAVGLTAEELRRLLAAAAAHSARTHALVALLTFCGLRISEALGADVRDYGHDHGHRVLKITRKGGKNARTPLPPPVVRALDDYLTHTANDGLEQRNSPELRDGREQRTTGPLFLSADGTGRYPYTSAYEQLRRLCRTAGLPAGVTPHSLRHSYATENLRLGAALQDVQDAMGHADPRTTRRYDRSRHQLDRSPNYLLAASLTGDS